MPEAVETALQGGFDSLLSIGTAVVLMGLAAAVSLLGISQAAVFGLKWLKSMFSRAV